MTGSLTLAPGLVELHDGDAAAICGGEGESGKLKLLLKVGKWVIDNWADIEAGYASVCNGK
jgi:hypothetical protein